MNKIIEKTAWSRVLLNLWENHKNEIEGILDDETTLPKNEDIFKAFTFFKEEDLKVVILGQDVYQNEGLANGLCFSVPNGYKIPPSLRNIFKELERTYGIKRTDTDLSDWARQGVLLLNTALTVKMNISGSHTKQWKNFTRDLIKYIGSFEHIVFILWGNHAQSFIEYIDIDKNLVLTHTHPSPLSRKPFMGNNHFQLCNDYLEKTHKYSIKWV
jgi:uracil-DNA glycosylase